jgi:hypothetical protein
MEEEKKSDRDETMRKGTEREGRSKGVEIHKILLAWFNAEGRIWLRIALHKKSHPRFHEWDQ